MKVFLETTKVTLRFHCFRKLYMFIFIFLYLNFKWKVIVSDCDRSLLCYSCLFVAVVAYSEIMRDIKQTNRKRHSQIERKIERQKLRNLSN